MQVVLSGLQFCAGGVIEGSTSLLGVTAMDCVVPQLSGSGGAVATFISQRTFTLIKILTALIFFQLVLSLLDSLLDTSSRNLVGPEHFLYWNLSV